MLLQGDKMVLVRTLDCPKKLFTKKQSVEEAKAGTQRDFCKKRR